MVGRSFQFVFFVLYIALEGLLVIPLLSLGIELLLPLRPLQTFREDRRVEIKHCLVLRRQPILFNRWEKSLLKVS